MQFEGTNADEKLNESPGRIRNFCMLAHVDHGKTTLSDYLVASNGILSLHLAGEVLLLDSRPDEQERRITMKASSIALNHTHRGVGYILNLVDSPGHIDFSCEVSTAMRLCDGAMIIVDVIDGVTQQTCTLLRHSYDEGLSMCLVLNKIDVLTTVTRCTPEEAYTRMRSIIETCNATLAAHANQVKIQGLKYDLESGDASEDVWFDPVKGNVLFCSAHDGWCFGVENFANLYKDKLPIKHFTQFLWGEYYLDRKIKKVSTIPIREGQQTLAVQLMLEPIWRLYAVFLENGDESQQRTMSNKLGIKESVWNLSRNNARTKLKTLLSHWMPLARSMLNAVCQHVESPVEAQRRRLPVLIPDFERMANLLKDSLLTCDPSPDGPCVVYICKLIDTRHLVGQSLGGIEVEDDPFIGLARVYCGRLRAGDQVFVHSAKQVIMSRVSKVFIFRGVGLEEVTEVSAGWLCGIGGLTPLITKYATISTVPDVAPFKPLMLPSTSIVRLSVFPKDPKNLQQLENGIRLLYKVDPQVEVSVLPTGEHVIGAAGAVHAERCIKDLVDTFAQVEVTASEPLVSFRESIVGNLNAKPKLYTRAFGNDAFSITVHARCMPQEVLDIIRDDEKNNSSNTNILRQVDAALRSHKRYTNEMKIGVISHGPMKFGFLGAVLLADFENAKDPETSHRVLNELEESIVAGFQAATENGPMAQEPLYGMAFVITELFIQEAVRLSSGMVLPCVRDAFLAAMEQHPCRLVEPIYECTVYSSGPTQGRIYSSLSRRRSQIIEEVHNEGSNLFFISCWLPAVEAFDLQDELRVLTQGASTTQLRMHHWAYIDADPFFVPTTKEELEEYGVQVSAKNVAVKLLESVKRRKGLFRERTVENAEKQKFSLKAA